MIGSEVDMNMPDAVQPGMISRLRALNAHLDADAEQLQRDLSRRIHDELSQTLMALQLELTMLGAAITDNPVAESRLSSALGLTTNLLTTTRSVMNELRPAVLDDLGILAALEWIVTRTTIECTVLSEPKEIELAPELSVAVFRIVEESLRNAETHGSATNAAVSLTAGGDIIRLVVSDDGTGFVPPNEPDSPVGQFGLLQMRERVDRLGGTLSIDSAIGRGTSIVVQLPASSEAAS
jgi:two-component system, NarL family, sensor histidine kinase UhpB